MTRRITTAMLLPALAGFLFVSTAFAETTPAGSQPAADDGSLVYEVHELQGNVRVAPMGTNPLLKEGWRPVKQGESLHTGQIVHVPFRGKLKLIARPADPPTVLLFDTGTLVQISELSLKDGVAKSRLDLGYGLVKAGVAESGTRSDMEITGPTATLSKKGTDIFGFEVRPDGRFNMFLTDQGRGLVQAIQTQSGQAGGLNAMRSRFLTPGQWITQQMARAIDNVQFDRNVNVSDLYGLKGMDQLFTMLNDRGIGFLLPAGSNPLNLLGNNPPNGGQPKGGPPNQQGQSLGGTLLSQGVGGGRIVGVGNFGIGQGTVPSVFGARAINRQNVAKKLMGSGCERPGIFAKRR